MVAKSTKVLVAALGLALAVAAGPASARVAIRGHQGAAPPWSFACIKDTGPTQCGEPMWIYGN